MQLMGQLVEEAVPPQSWQKHCDASLNECNDGEEPSGFPFYDNMMDLQFNVRSESKAKPACDERSPKTKANWNDVENEDEGGKAFERAYGW